MSPKPFNGIAPSKLLAALRRNDLQVEVASVQFRAKVPPHRSVVANEQWLRIKLILGCSEVYNALGISSLPIGIPGDFHYARGFEVIGTVANLLALGMRDAYADNRNQSLTAAREYLDAALSEDYKSAEAYSCQTGWCDWFIDEGILDETVLLGNQEDWWLLTVTGTD